MPRVKYNFAQLKLEFFVSGFVTLSEFLEHKGFKRDCSGGFGGHIEKNTRGWSKEKKDLEKKMFERAMKEYQEERTAEWKRAFVKLEKAELKQLEEFANLLIKGQVTERFINSQTGEEEERVVLDKYDYKQMRVVKPVIEVLTYIRLVLGKNDFQPEKIEEETISEEEMKMIEEIIGKRIQK